MRIAFVFSVLILAGCGESEPQVKDDPPQAGDYDQGYDRGRIDLCEEIKRKDQEIWTSLKDDKICSYQAPDWTTP